MRSLKTLLTVLGAVTVLVLAGNTVALAATGHSFILGKTNKANKVTTLKRTTAGPALNLTTTSAASAPFMANGRGKVANLNADMLDGYDSSQMVNSTTVYTKAISGSAVSTFALTTGTVPAGTYLATGSAWVYGPTSGAGVECSIGGSATTTKQWAWIPNNADGFYTPNLAGTITLTGAQSVVFTCNGDSFAYNTYSGAPLQLTLTKVSVPHTGSATRVAPQAGRLSPAAR